MNKLTSSIANKYYVDLYQTCILVVRLLYSLFRGLVGLYTILRGCYIQGSVLPLMTRVKNYFDCYMHACTHTHSHTKKKHPHTHALTHACTHTHVLTLTLILTHMHTHMHTHTNTYSTLIWSQMLNS